MAGNREIDNRIEGQVKFKINKLLQEEGKSGSDSGRRCEVLLKNMSDALLYLDSLFNQ